tara:strand:- start:429 stop:647 length:219 start_codon:yes stop_codon:yes gene_type:complete
MFRTYDYQCDKCETVFELMTKIDEVATCECCGNKKLKKLMSGPLFKLKGNGWPGKEFKAQSDCKAMADGKEI